MHYIIIILSKIKNTPLNNTNFKIPGETRFYLRQWCSIINHQVRWTQELPTSG